MTLIKRRSTVVCAVAAAIVLLSGCAPTAPGSSLSEATSSSTPKPGGTATPTPVSVDPVAVDPVVVDPALFLLDGTPGVPDAEGSWSGHYGFFTDASKTVRCDLYVFSGDSGGANCSITLGNESLRSYTVPVDVSTECVLIASNSSDGYSVGINFKAFDTGSAGFTGCRLSQEQADPAILAATRVLGENQLLKVSAAYENYACTVSAGIASCSEASSGASIRFGTSIAEYAG